MRDPQSRMRWRIAPHLLFRIPFLMPVGPVGTERTRIELVDAFFEAYDFYQPLKRGKPHTRLSPDELFQLEPGLFGGRTAEGLKGGISFDEWGIDGARLCVANAIDAREHGAEIHTHAVVEEILRAAEKCTRVIRDLLALVRQESLERSAASVKQVKQGARILVVDDEPGISEVLAEVFQLDGHVVEIVGNGEEALEKLAAERYDLILSDVHMPDLDGPALYREVERRHPDLLPLFIFLTGDIMSPETAQFLAQTTVPCLSKPFTLDMVRDLVQRVLTETSHR